MFNALVGDVQGNGLTSTQDMIAVKQALATSNVFGTVTTAPVYRFDIDGSGRIAVSDINQIRSALPGIFGIRATALPQVQRPTAQAFAHLATGQAALSGSSVTLRQQAFAQFAGDQALVTATTEGGSSTKKILPPLLPPAGAS